MIRAVDVDEILTELQALAEQTTGAATVAILACMDVVERHGRIADERAEPLLKQHPVERPGPPRPLDSSDPRLKLRDRGGRSFRRGTS